MKAELKAEGMDVIHNWLETSTIHSGGPQRAGGHQPAVPVVFHRRAIYVIPSSILKIG